MSYLVNKFQLYEAYYKCVFILLLLLSCVELNNRLDVTLFRCNIQWMSQTRNCRSVLLHSSTTRRSKQQLYVYVESKVIRCEC